MENDSRFKPLSICAFAFLVLSLLSTACLHRAPKEAQVAQATPSPSVSQIVLPSRTGVVNDFANVLDPAQEKELEATIIKLQHEVNAEFAIATVETTAGQPIFDYSLALAKSWKPGGDSGRGLLLVLAIKDRQWRLQVTRSLESDLPNEVCAQLAEPSLPLYKEGKYAAGVERYVRALGERLKSRMTSNSNQSSP